MGHVLIRIERVYRYFEGYAVLPRNLLCIDHECCRHAHAKLSEGTFLAKCIDCLRGKGARRAECILWLPLR